MTYYVAAEQLRPGREIVVAPYDPEPGESLAGFEPGDTVTVRDALYGLMVPSGNDAALTLALAVSGSESDFVSRMNAAADELGLAETDYLDPIGLNAGNVSSARDLVDLATELREQDLFREIVDTPRITLRSTAEPIQDREPQCPGPRRAVHRRDQDRDDAGGRLRPGRIRNPEGGWPRLGGPGLAGRSVARLGDPGPHGLRLLALRRASAGQARASALDSRTLAEGGRLPLVAGASVKEVARADQEVDVELAEIAPVAAPVAEGDQSAVAVVRLDGQAGGGGGRRGSARGRGSPRAGGEQHGPSLLGLDRVRRRGADRLRAGSFLQPESTVASSGTLRDPRRDSHRHPQRSDRPNGRGPKFPARPAPPRGRVAHRRGRQGRERRAGAQAPRPAGDRNRASSAARPGTRIVERLGEESILNDFTRIAGESRTNLAVVDPTTGEQTEINERGPTGDARRRSTGSSRSSSTSRRARRSASSPGRSRRGAIPTSTRAS